ncbi:peptidoglycan DD-metalloendopeptidase family protein [Pseudanabaena sp. FACHB-2040]|uniref:peptidoglycan DD-metalloendopeptidase family protein n=1 Tax=Pseudanabaena sp. FACHB-2040 TaxID=2692859 RepID=UPI0016895F59|nr:peptidoglycan DD-metalloendopeptidase family protein [Pseudanabaena sp. FACHB-2040]MBD2256646.1 peptidoglycan DD-metalloendopeptidase family protein [Pseudanabaena sp. FACHB-2040]
MTRLLAPYARVTIGGDTFTWGDGYVKSVEVTLGEGQNSSSCRLAIYDPGRKFADKYFAYIEEIQGLEPLRVPQSQTRSTGTTGTSTGAQGTSTGDLNANMKAVLDLIAWAEGANYNTLFGGSTFSSFADHPRRVIRRSGFSSSAAGRYQALETTWDEVKNQLNLPDFTPQSQDRFAIKRIEFRGATADVANANWPALLDKISWEWASLPTSTGSFRYSGQGTKTPQQCYDFLNARLGSYDPGKEEQQAATDSVQTTTAVTPEQQASRQKALAGSQITVELGFNGKLLVAYSFLHTSLEYSMYDHDTLVFGGQAAVWVLTQRKRNTAYTNVTFKQVAEKICAAYGLTLDMPNDGPKYEYFPQRGQTDYEALLIEARRIGYRVKCRGNTLSIKPREAGKDAFTLEFGDNLGLSFTVKHQAQSDSSGGARSSEPSQQTSTGQRKVILDPDTGEQKVIQPESPVGAGQGPEQSTTGASTVALAPRTDGATTEADAARRESELRIKGIIADWQAPTTPELLLLDPDSLLRTVGVTKTLDRVWVIDTITHQLDVSSGFSSSGTCYTPLKNKYPQPPPQAPTAATAGTAEGAPPPPLNANGFIRPCSGVVTSRFRTARRPNHQGIDIADRAGTPIYASADGVASGVVTSCPGLTAQDSCGGGYGNRAYINHADGFQTRYAHLATVSVSNGQQVKQGQLLGTMGNSGASRGVHLHYEIRKGGTAQNPENYIKF